MNFFQFVQRFPHKKPNAFLYAVSGEADAFRDEIVSRIVTRHRPGDLDFVKGVAANEAQAISALAIQPTRGHRLVVLSDFDRWGNRDMLAQWIESRKSGNIVAIFTSTAKSPKTDNSFAQVIIRRGWWVVCRKPDREDVVAFLSTAFDLKGSVAETVVDSVGTDFNRIRNLITKLRFMTGGKHPSVKDIEEAALGYVSTAFATVDALIDKRKPKALNLLDHAQIPAILTLLRRRFEQLIQVRALESVGRSPQEIAEQTNIPLFLIGGLIAKSKTVTLDRCARALSLIAEAEIDMTVNRFHAPTVFYRMVLQI